MVVHGRTNDPSPFDVKVGEGGGPVDHESNVRPMLPRDAEKHALTSITPRMNSSPFYKKGRERTTPSPPNHNSIGDSNTPLCHTPTHGRRLKRKPESQKRNDTRRRKCDKRCRAPTSGETAAFRVQ